MSLRRRVRLEARRRAVRHLDDALSPDAPDRRDVIVHFVGRVSAALALLRLAESDLLKEEDEQSADAPSDEACDHNAGLCAGHGQIEPSP